EDPHVQAAMERAVARLTPDEKKLVSEAFQIYGEFVANPRLFRNLGASDFETIWTMNVLTYISDGTSLQPFARSTSQPNRSSS
ncbi:MAG: hypothetical protein ABIQ44_08730, partial [Chloroflexia bacterium]